MGNRLLKGVLIITDTIKPALVRFIPLSILRKTKKKIIESYTKHENYKRESFDKNYYPDGINFIGSIKSDTGLGQSCRLLINTILGANIKLTTYNYNLTNPATNKECEYDHIINEEFKYNINLIHITPLDLPLAIATIDEKFWNKRYNIGYWLWELEEFPNEWAKSFKYVDEIWTPSEFISRSIRKKTNLPVNTIPYAIKVDIDEEITRKKFNLPEDKFLFLTMFNSHSVMERKNPFGVIEAYKKAFEIDGDANVGLVIKGSNLSKSDLSKIKDMLKGYENIFLLDMICSKKEVDSLISLCDVLVSLHRAEGYGLPIAEAMLLGTPTIATNWSANTEFSSDDSNCLVDYVLVEIEEDYAVFKKGNRWADPDINQAAEYMGRLKNDREYYNKISDNGKRYIQKQLNQEKIAGLIKARVKEILEGA